MSLLELFYDVDEFWQSFQPHFQQAMLGSGAAQRIRPGQLSVSDLGELLACRLTPGNVAKGNMKNRLVLLGNKVLLRKRAIIETINETISQIEQTRHRSVANFLLNSLTGKPLVGPVRLSRLGL